MLICIQFKPLDGKYFAAATEIGEIQVNAVDG